MHCINSYNYRNCYRFISILLMAILISGCGLNVFRSGGGGYYSNDGPGSPPPNLDAVPDAIPRAEPIRPANSRPYTVSGVTYTPMTSLQPYKARGIASWYGQKFHGQATASGEIYDMYGMTAAHKTLPLPSYVRVTRVSTGKSVIVRVNDRGPFLHNREIDLSYTAAHKLDIIKPGSAEVVVELILPGEMSSMPVSTPSVPVYTASVPQYGVFVVQVGAFSDYSKAQARKDQIHQYYRSLQATVSIESANNVYRVQIGPYNARPSAEELVNQIRYDLGIDAIILTK